MPNEKGEILETKAETSFFSKKGTQLIIGIILMVLYLGVWAMLIDDLLVSPTRQLQSRERAVQMLQEEKRVTFTDTQRALILHEMKIGHLLSFLLLPLSLSPLFILGLHLIQGPNHVFWAWQKNRIKRHPIIASIFLFFGLSGALRLFLTRMLNPIQSVESMSKPNLDLYLAPVLAVICLSLSFWFYLGKRKKETVV